MLRQFFIRVIHQIPAVSKTTALWALGLLHLICLFQFPARSLNTQLWLRRLRSLCVNPITYTFAYFETAAVVYIKMPFHQPTSAKPWMYNQHGRFYVGSTNIGVSKREFNRMAKLRQVKLDKAVSCELAIKYWAKRLDFPLFTILVLKTFDAYSEAWTFEHLLMSKWQAPLNFPFITRFLSLKSTGWLVQIKKHQQSFSSMPTGDRLFQRVRRRLHTMGVAPSIHSCQAQAWRTLYCLTAPGRLSFDTGIFHDWEVYALYRSAGHLEQPTRTHARKLLKKILEFRNLTVPKLNKPLAIPLMAHPTFKESVQRFLRDHIWNHIDLAIPLHLPTHKIREAASPTLGPALFNFRRMETLFDFSNPDSVPCSCFDIWKRLQRSQRPPSPHYECVAIAAALEQFQFPPDLQIFQNANSRSTYFRSRTDVFKNFEERLLLWTRHHGLPPCSVALVSQF